MALTAHCGPYTESYCVWVCSLDYYRETSIVFMGIENIHSMRDSIRKLFELIKNEARGNERSNWWSCLEVRPY